MEKAPIYLSLRSSERKCEGLFKKVQYLNRLLNRKLAFFSSYGFPTLLLQIDARPTFPDFFRGKFRDFSVEGGNKRKIPDTIPVTGDISKRKMEHQECDFRFKMPVQPDTHGSEMLDRISPVS
ncbi:hypothetical protein CDAR_615081 [Caerostris darwini]|uniref:Uncharacterized protein n=1 Tax=Caerostris darwini TaxID=1538125 RepID=A0AAV4T5G9_9ARAC|nr:hypothetical protein CDAR_615081 [Caerostris darwini]